MCGIYYSNKINAFNSTGLKRRGPEKWTEEQNELGHFGHGLLSTIGEKTEQPIHNSHGILLYNGSTYNQKSNDTKFISDNLNDKVEDCVEFIKTLKGEFALIYNTEKFVVFGCDVFAVRPLYFYFDEQTISVASYPQALEHHIAQYRCEGNKIYVYDKTTKHLRNVTNKEWNLIQNINNYDKVFENFEEAVQLRHTDNNMYTVSGGHDTGVIACCLEKKFKSFHGSFVFPHGEDERIMKQRAIRHRLKPANFKETEDLHTAEEVRQMLLRRNAESENSYASNGLTTIILRYMKPNNMKILVMGSGGDEIYADYGFAGESIDWHGAGGKKEQATDSKFGGHFPPNLELVWPWHNFVQYQSKFIEKHEAVGGYWGIEVRCPLLDADLVQSWLNTTHTLKNKEYKGWMAEYMRQNHYPFSDKKKTIFAW